MTLNGKVLTTRVEVSWESSDVKNLFINKQLVSAKSVPNQFCTLPENLWKALFQRCSALWKPFFLASQKISAEQRCFTVDFLRISVAQRWSKFITLLPEVSKKVLFARFLHTIRSFNWKTQYSSCIFVIQVKCSHGVVKKDLLHHFEFLTKFWLEFFHSLNTLNHCLFGDHNIFPNTTPPFPVNFLLILPSAEQTWIIENQGWSALKQLWSSLVFLMSSETALIIAGVSYVLWNSSDQRWCFLCPLKQLWSALVFLMSSETALIIAGVSYVAWNSSESRQTSETMLFSVEYLRYFNPGRHTFFII